MNASLLLSMLFRIAQYCIPQLPCDPHVGELAPSYRRVSASLIAGSGQVGEGDDPHSNVATVVNCTI